jgi:hypothetical protein
VDAAQAPYPPYTRSRPVRIDALIHSPPTPGELIMSLAELIYQSSRELPLEKAQEVFDFIEFLKNRRPMITIDRPDDYEWAQQQALMFLDAPPFTLDGRYGSRDSLYDRS